jgi:hypothetical protein
MDDGNSTVPTPEVEEAESAGGPEVAPSEPQSGDGEVSEK